MSINSEYRIEKPKSSLRNILFLAVALLAVVVAVAFVYYFTKVNKAATSDSREVSFSVERGSSTRQIATGLEDEKVINNKNIFLIYTRLNNAADKIQAGDYLLNSNMTVAEIVGVLTGGRVVPNYRTATIIEGWNNKQIAKYLADREFIESESDFENVLETEDFNFKFSTEGATVDYEGFLFPDTYTISGDASVSDLVIKMLANFESKISDQMMEDIESQGRTLREVLILASIIEKEVGRNKTTITSEDREMMSRERKLVASVFLNRLEINMGLESDATVNYITGKSDRSVLIVDTQIDSPYNTYRYRGLPPGPISNPGLDSIMAAIYPTESDYLFFLNSPEGVAYFGKTLAEHNENRVRYLR